MKTNSPLFSRRSGRSVSALAFLLLLLTACGSDGCGIDGFRDAPYPLEHVDKTVPVSAEVRVTSHGLEFMSGQVENLIGEFQEGGLSFCVPPQDGSNFQACHEDSVCDDNTTGCQLNLTIEEADLIPIPNDTLEVQIEIGNLKNSLPVYGEVSFIKLSCWLDLGSKANFNEPAVIPARIPIQFEVDSLSPYRDLRFKLGDMNVDISDVDYRLSGRGSSTAACGSMGFLVQTFVDSTLRSLIRDEIEQLAEDVSREQLCRPCGEGEPACPSNSMCDEDGGAPVCMYQATNECVPRLLGIEGVIEPQALLGDFVMGLASDIFMTGRVADRGVADTGLTLGARVGTEPERYSQCAPVDLTTRPSFAAIDPSPSLNSDINPEGLPFMFGMAIHRRTFQHLFWSLWASGSLCLEVGSDTVDMLTTGSIGALVPAVNQIALRQGPMKILLSPQKAPDIRLGSNRVVGSGSDQVVEEGLLILDWRELDIHMYGFVLERYARLFTIRVDLELPIAVLPDGEVGVFPVLGNVEDAIQNIQVLNDEIVDADHDRIKELLPVLLGFALPQLAESLSDPIELPQFLGYKVVINEGDLRGIDNNQYLGLFANLEYVGFEQDPDGDGSNLLRSNFDEPKVRIDDSSGMPRVTVELRAGVKAGTRVVNSERVQYAYRLDGGPWHLLGTGEDLVLRDPRLRVQGIHQLEIRAREMVKGARWQRVPTATEIRVDYEAPKVEAWADLGRVEVRAYDLVDPVEALEQRHRVVESGQKGAWSPWGPVAAISTEGLSLAERFSVELEVRDRSGHVAEEEVRVIRQAQEEDAPEESAAGGCGGCAATGGGAGSTGGLLLLVALFGALKLRRRRLLGLSALLVLFVSSGCGGCGGEVEGNEICEEECGPGESCVEGVCEILVCQDDGECDLECPSGEFARCVAGGCECVAFCAGGCGSDQFCCFESNSCEGFPNWCADVNCDPGFEAVITHIGDHDNQSCEVTGGSCECVVMPPIPLWYHGAYASIAQGAGVTAISVHNLHYRDLMVGIINTKLDDVEEWYFVDGVPRRGTVQGDPNGPRRGIINIGDRVGTHTATAVDGDGVIHVFYRDEDNDLLKYARGIRDGEEWSFEKVNVDEEGDTGYFSSVVLLDETLHLFYTARQEGDLSQIRYRAIETSTAVGEVAESEVVVLHLGVREASNREADLSVAGLHLQAVAYEEGIFLSFFDNTIGQPGWIIFDGEEFSAPEFLNLGEPLGGYSSARPDANGDVHVVYMEAMPPALAYRVAGQGREKIADGVRHTLNGTVQAEIGHDAQLQVFEDGRVEVFFHDATTHELIRAVRDGSWTVESLAGQPGVRSAAHGLFPRVLEVDGNRRLVVDFAIDNTGEVRKGHPVLRLLQ